MPFAHVCHTIDGDTDSSVTTDALDTSGSTLLVASMAYYDSTTPPITDNYSNIWNTSLTLHESTGSSSYKHRLAYCIDPVVGAGHTFTMAGGFTFPCLGVIGFSGANPSYEGHENGAGAEAGQINAGSVTPGEDNCLIVTGLNGGQASSITLDGGFTYYSLDQTGGVHLGGGIGFLIQTTAGAVNPLWDWPGAVNSAASIAVFKLSSAVNRKRMYGGGFT